jgi:hypothetical protein
MVRLEKLTAVAVEDLKYSTVIFPAGAVGKSEG